MIGELPKKKCKKCGKYTDDYQCWMIADKDEDIYLCKECDTALNEHFRAFFKKPKKVKKEAL